MIQLKQSEIELLKMSASALIAHLKEWKDLLHAKQTAYEFYCRETNETFHVQVSVTRDETEFLDAFQTEELRSAKIE
jgi:hypothetical protein